jgi:spore maturation protein CgeB
MKPTIAFLGSSLVSAYWNGAATYYRGIIRALAQLGYDITFYEPDAYDRQRHRDIADPAWARVVVYPGAPADETGVRRALQQASSADILIKCSGVGVFDALLTQVIVWAVDAPATLERLLDNPDDAFASLIGGYDLILTYGGGDAVVRGYMAAGARRCVPIYNALDPTTHFPVEADERFTGDLGFLGNRLPDREARVEEFFLATAANCPRTKFVLGGNGWVGHVYTADHNAFNCTPRAVLNISRESMARYGFSPATRVFEAAGAGACLITDEWIGIEMFLEPDREVLVASDGAAVADLIDGLDAERAKRIGAAARRRILREHTYAHRAAELDAILTTASRLARTEVA